MRLLGLTHPLGRKWSTPVLPSPEVLFNCPVTLKYAVTTTVGCEISNRFLAELGLKNIILQVNSKEGLIENLSTEGFNSIKDGTFFVPNSHKVLANPNQHLIRPCFENLYVWQTEDRARRAMAFCEEIGLQLFRHYLQWKKWDWSEDRIRCCGLGMNGFGLVLAFSQSIPKASLPLLWMDGRIRFRNRELEWMPLFHDGKA